MTKQWLPENIELSTLVGRVWLPAACSSNLGGPAVVTVNDGMIYDVSEFAATCAQLLSNKDRLALIREATQRQAICTLNELIENSLTAKKDSIHMLAPIDLQCIKACGVTFVDSMIERVIEEHAKGDPKVANNIRDRIAARLGDDVGSVVPGSQAADELKEALIEEGIWSQYLEVGIGPYAEVFTKSQVLSAVGFGQQVGIHPESIWNNPEPEVALIMNGDCEVVGATLANDVNLRDFEGRSALLLGKAKDNNASCAIGPFIRLFDENFQLDDVRNAEVKVEVWDKSDKLVLDDKSTMNKISRDVLDLVTQASGNNHQYPDGFLLMTGTLFAPTQDRDVKGMGFTHEVGDKVKISSPKFGSLFNSVTTSDRAAPWTFGIVALIENLKSRDLI